MSVGLWLRCIPFVVLGLAVASAAAGATFTVDSEALDGDLAPGDGACETAAGECTLTAALLESNALPGADEIQLVGGSHDGRGTGVTDDLTLLGGGASVAFLGTLEAPARVTIQQVTFPTRDTLPCPSSSPVFVRGADVLFDACIFVGAGTCGSRVTGHALSVDGGRAELRSCTVRDHAAGGDDWPHALAVTDGELLLSGGSVSGQRTLNGSVFHALRSVLTVNGTAIVDVTTAVDFPAYPGWLLSAEDSDVVLRDLVPRQIESGAALVLARGGTLEVEDCSFGGILGQFGGDVTGPVLEVRGAARTLLTRTSVSDVLAWGGPIQVEADEVQVDGLELRDVQIFQVSWTPLLALEALGTCSVRGLAVLDCEGDTFDAPGVLLAGSDVLLEDSVLAGVECTGPVTPALLELRSDGPADVARTALVENVVPRAVILSRSSDLLVENVSLLDNRAGGAVVEAVEGGTVLSFTTVVGNELAVGAAALRSDGLTLGASILAGNRGADGTLAHCDGTVVLAGANLVDDASSCELQGDVAELVLGDPLLGALELRATSGASRSPLAGSPALDATPALPASATDQRGGPRPLDADFDGIALADLGAVELSPCGPDGDGDGRGDACDCDPDDGADDGLRPPEIPLLGVFRPAGAPPGEGGALIAWSDLSAGLGRPLAHDVVRGALRDLRSGSWASTCLADDVPSTSLLDAEPGTAWYLARAAADCAGTWGAGALDAASPCP